MSVQTSGEYDSQGRGKAINWNGSGPDTDARASNDVKSAVITYSRCSESWRCKRYRKSETELLKVKTTAYEMKSVLGGINGRSDVGEKSLVNPKTETETVQWKREEKRMKEKEPHTRERALGPSRDTPHVHLSPRRGRDARAGGFRDGPQWPCLLALASRATRSPRVWWTLSKKYGTNDGASLVRGCHSGRWLTCSHSLLLASGEARTREAVTHPHDELTEFCPHPREWTQGLIPSW